MQAVSGQAGLIISERAHYLFKQEVGVWTTKNIKKWLGWRTWGPLATETSGYTTPSEEIAVRTNE